MRRREFLTGAAAAGVTAAAAGVTAAAAGRALPEPGADAGPDAGKLTPPASGAINVAVALTEGATVIDFAGPWEVFQDVSVNERSPFRLYTVGESVKPIMGSGGLQLVPDYSFASAPQPAVIVVGAQRGGDALLAWLRRASQKADMTMSVCTGAFQLARAGLLSGKSATTHHAFTDRLASMFPDVNVKRGLRFVESGPRLATAGGLSSGIDLALRVVERYFGRPAAERTAAYMEYQGRGWVV
jgi:transcriptional regulator GlxA family with amidase domain